MRLDRAGGGDASDAVRMAGGTGALLLSAGAGELATDTSGAAQVMRRLLPPPPPQPGVATGVAPLPLLWIGDPSAPTNGESMMFGRTPTEENGCSGAGMWEELELLSERGRDAAAR